MKRTSLILGIALTLSSSTANLRAGGCGGCGGCWAFVPLAFVAGIAIASAASAHSSPTYVYVPPPYYYPYSYPQSQAPSSQQPAQDPSSSTAPAMSSLEQASRWVPSSPGAGHWVPDPTPYVYEPVPQSKLVAANARPATQLLSVNRSAGQVPVYQVTP